MDIQVSGDIKLADKHLEITFKIDDPNAEIQGAPVETHWNCDGLTRMDGLWTKTCFEAFWSTPNDKKYWEFNVSPQGEWNLYFFGKYREPQPPRSCDDFKLIDLRTTPTEIICRLSTHLDIAEIEASLCSVIKLKNNQIHYLSTKHAGEKPDFHVRSSFTIKRGSQ